MYINSSPAFELSGVRNKMIWRLFRLRDNIKNFAANAILELIQLKFFLEFFRITVCYLEMLDRFLLSKT